MQPAPAAEPFTERWLVESDPDHVGAAPPAPTRPIAAVAPPGGSAGLDILPLASPHQPGGASVFGSGVGAAGFGHSNVPQGMAGFRQAGMYPADAAAPPLQGLYPQRTLPFGMLPEDYLPVPWDMSASIGAASGPIPSARDAYFGMPDGRRIIFRARTANGVGSAAGDVPRQVAYAWGLDGRRWIFTAPDVAASGTVGGSNNGPTNIANSSQNVLRMTNDTSDSGRYAGFPSVAYFNDRGVQSYPADSPLSNNSSADAATSGAPLPPHIETWRQAWSGPSIPGNLDALRDAILALRANAFPEQPGNDIEVGIYPDQLPKTQKHSLLDRPENTTFYLAEHEFQHARLYTVLGRERYQALSRAQIEVHMLREMSKIGNWNDREVKNMYDAIRAARNKEVDPFGHYPDDILDAKPTNKQINAKIAEGFYDIPGVD